MIIVLLYVIWTDLLGMSKPTCCPLINITPWNRELFFCYPLPHKQWYHAPKKQRTMQDNKDGSTTKLNISYTSMHLPVFPHACPESLRSHLPPLRWVPQGRSASHPGKPWICPCQTSPRDERKNGLNNQTLADQCPECILTHNITLKQVLHHHINFYYL